MSSLDTPARPLSGHRRRRWLAGLLTPLLALTLAAVPGSAARADEAEDEWAPSSRSAALYLMRFGGPSAAKAAKAALVGSEADVQRFLDEDEPTLRTTDIRTQITGLLTTGGPGVQIAAARALDGTDEDRNNFLAYGFEAAWLQDERARTLQVHNTGGYAVQAAAKKAMDSGDDAITEFLASGQFVAQQQDDRAAILAVMSTGGTATKEMARAALAAGPEAITEFLATGVEVGRARDVTLATVTELAAEAKAAGLKAAKETAAAELAAKQANAAAARAKASAQVAAEETRLAKDSAVKAARAAGRAADAASQAADAAEVAIGAAAQAHTAARAAATAAGRAARAAVLAEDAATRAWGQASLAWNDKQAADNARIAANSALEIARAAKIAADAADQARLAGDASGDAALAAASASGHAQLAADASDEAGGYSQAAGAEAERARRNAATARRAATRATRAANAAVAFARKAAAAAGEAAAAARDSASHAQAAAVAARAAADSAGEARDKAQKAREHADAAIVAANASSAAAQQAVKVADLADTAEVERLRELTDQGIVQAEAALAEDRKIAAQVAWDAEETSRRDAETRTLLAEAGAPGAPTETVVQKGREAAVRLLNVSGPYTRGAAEEALTGGEVEIRAFLDTNLATATEQDDRTRVASIAEFGEPAALRTAAESALDGSAATVREFLKTQYYEGKEHDDRAKILQIMNVGAASKQTATAALDGTAEQRLDFLRRGQYTAAEHDERTKILAILNSKPGREVEAAARIALAGPQSYMRGFLDVGKAQAEERDLLAATHNARVDAMVAEALKAAAAAQESAYRAAEAAARARADSASADRYAKQAADSATAAANHASAARNSAQQAKASAQQAAASAATARNAAAAARVSARKAEASAADARWSAHVAKGHADNAKRAAADAKLSAEKAGESARLAQEDYDEAYEIALGLILEEEEVRRNNPDPEGDKKCNRPPGYGGDASCYPSLPGMQRTDQDGDIVCWSWAIEDGNRQCGYRVVSDEERLKFQQERDAQNTLNACALFIPGCLGILSGVFAVLDPETRGDPQAMLDEVTERMLGRKLDALKRQQRLLDLLECRKKAGGNSFDADTRVLMADGTSKPISEVRLRDRVLATDPVRNITGPGEVTALHRNQDTELTDVVVRDSRGGTTTVDTTAGHPFWNSTTGAWAPADKLTTDDRLRTADGTEASVVDAWSFTGDQTMFNLTVEDANTYYVLAGDSAVLVHNVSCRDALEHRSEGDPKEVEAHNKLVDRRFDHTWGEHAHEWFGYRKGEVPSGLRAEWERLIKDVSRSKATGRWSAGKDRTIFHMAKVDGKWFSVHYYASGPNVGYLATAYRVHEKNVRTMQARVRAHRQ
ncbi:polymorphic toxin-type HINT domain-containing protein [Actinoplanes sp. M2I2]|uniref:polymorphic toxin-type HINT domain-containing protein n=1 Tax=Actinoplanes sp. M2I2 TaxID=1734444 RepID=UPI0020215709|nr:polymorphic toxin-type HINT domain-containing protein [Actinoplanes sp. M2I2]